MEKMAADMSQFVLRYENLKKLYFSERSNPVFENGQEIPSAYMSKTQIVRALQEDLKVHIPSSLAERKIRFLDGSIFDY